MIFRSLGRYRAAGLLLLRVAFGLYIAIYHGWDKISGGPEAWVQYGQAMEIFGIGFLPVFWGFMAAVAEFVGGLLVAAGLLTRAALILLFINMTVAFTAHATGAIEGNPERAFLYGMVWLALFLTGPGAYSLDAQFGGSSNPRRARRL